MSFSVIEGNAVAGATLRENGSGKHIANVVVRVDQRVRNSDGSYTDGPTSGYKVTVWGKPAPPSPAAPARECGSWPPAS